MSWLRCHRQNVVVGVHCQQAWSTDAVHHLQLTSRALVRRCKSPLVHISSTQTLSCPESVHHEPQHTARDSQQPGVRIVGCDIMFCLTTVAAHRLSLSIHPSYSWMSDSEHIGSRDCSRGERVSRHQCKLAFRDVHVATVHFSIRHHSQLCAAGEVERLLDRTGSQGRCEVSDFNVRVAPNYVAVWLLI